MSKIDTCSDFELETAIIGSLLADNSNFAHIENILAHDHFADPATSHIFKLISEGIRAGDVVSPITLKSRLIQDDGNDELFQYSIQSVISQAVPSTLPGIAKTIRDLYVRRQAMNVTTDIYRLAHETVREGGFSERLSEGLQMLSRLAMYSSGRVLSLFTAKEASRSAIEAIRLARAGGQGLVGESTGMKALDHILGGWQKELVILGGRPSMGKTALALQTALNVALAGGGVYYYSGEMSKEALQTRNITSKIWMQDASVAYSNVLRGKIDDTQMRWVEQGAEELDGIPMFIEERPGITVEELEASIRVAKMRFEQKGIELKLIVVDHMHKMRSRSPGKMVEQMTEISRGLAEMPKRFSACVLALAQLSRALETRDDKRPMLSDLRESGSLEQDADSVIFCYRPVYYLEREGKRKKMDAEADRQADISAMKNTMEVIVAKQRQGPIGSVKLFADMPANKIMDMSEAMAKDENYSEENSLQF